MSSIYSHRLACGREFGGVLQKAILRLPQRYRLVFTVSSGREWPNLGQDYILGLDYHGQGGYHGHDNMPILPHAERQYKDQLAQLFQDSGWELLRPDSLKADLQIRKGKLQYVLEVKRAAESRRDRIVPLLAEAILQARHNAQAIGKVRPLAIIAAPHHSRAVVDQAVQFQQEYAPDVGIGFIDDRGLRVFRAQGLDHLNSLPEGNEHKKSELGQSKSHPLFSDLGQWMLKVILAQWLDPKLLNAPRRKIHNASELALAAGVSQVSASRLVRQLEAEGFLNRDRDQLELVRLQDLFEEWQAAARRAYEEIPCRWIIPGHGRKQFEAALRDQHMQRSGGDSRGISGSVNSPRLCLGLFAAADALGLGFVHGVPPLLYIERIDPELMQRLGISRERASKADIYLRVPVYKESVFRAAVEQRGVPVSDVLQIWLDASNYPSRGKEQADRLREMVLEPLLRAN